MASSVVSLTCTFGLRGNKAMRQQANSYSFIVHYSLFTVHYYSSVQECDARKAS